LFVAAVGKVFAAFLVGLAIRASAHILLNEFGAGLLAGLGLWGFRHSGESHHRNYYEA
jgi:hypothetical protein